MFECIRINSIRSNHHEIVIQIRSRTSCDLERFVTTGGSNYRVSGRYGRNNIFDDSLSQRPCDTFNFELFGTSRRDGEEPTNVLRIVGVKLFVCWSSIRLWYSSQRGITDHHGYEAILLQKPILYNAQEVVECWQWYI